MTRLLALDQGTTSSRAIVFDTEGRALAVAQREFEQHFPAPDRVEHDAEEIWRTQRDVAIEAIARAKLDASKIHAIGITNQRETTVIWDRRTLEPIGRAIVWQDRRTADRCSRMRADGLEPAIREKTGLVLDPYFSATKIAWMLDHHQGARARAERGELAFGTIDCWLAARLTDGVRHVIDISNASRTSLFNLTTRDWDDELLSWFDVPRAVLPEIVPSSGVVADASVEGLSGIPIAGMLGDQQSALAGQACLEPGEAKNTYGTGCFLLLNTGANIPRSRSGLLSTVAWTFGDRTSYALEGSVFIGGAAVQWLRDGLGILESSSDVESLAKSVDNAGDLVFVPALAGLGTPHWDPHARGTMIGITRGTTGAHIARATLEGIAHQVVDLTSAMQADTNTEISELRVDGGAASNDLLLQIQADLLRAPVVRPIILETTALGAAYAAGLATGVWKEPREIRENWREDARFEPRMPDAEAKRARERWAVAVERSRGWAAN